MFKLELFKIDHEVTARIRCNSCKAATAFSTRCFGCHQPIPIKILSQRDIVNMETKFFSIIKHRYRNG